MKKILLITGLVIILSIGVLFGASYLRYRRSWEYQAWKQIGETQEQIAKDTMGGTTPEETIRLFVEALKKDDIELASQYYYYKTRADGIKFLQELKTHDVIPQVVSDLSNNKQRKEAFRTESMVTYDIFTSEQLQELRVNIELIRLPTGIWKIEEI